MRLLNIPSGSDVIALFDKYLHVYRKLKIVEGHSESKGYFKIDNLLLSGRLLVSQVLDVPPFTNLLLLWLYCCCLMFLAKSYVIFNNYSTSARWI